MKGGALALFGTPTIPAFLTRSVMAEMTHGGRERKKLVVLFQRGAVDGLNVVVPYQEKNYYAMRPTIAIKQNEVIDLNGFFGLHPQMAAFKPLYDAGASGDCACGGFAGSDAIAFRCAGLYGERNAGREGDGGWLAEPRAAGVACSGTTFGVPRGCVGYAGSADAAGQASGDCAQ